MVQIKIIRHSERLDYSRPLYWLLCFGHYWADTPLTRNGHVIANVKGKEMVTTDFNPKYIYTSPYTRTMATATEIKDSFPHSEIIIEPLLAEYQPYYKHNINLYPNGIPTTYDGQETEFVYPESYETFEKRIKFIISKLIEKHDTDIIIVTHGEVLKTYINYIQSLYPDLMLDPGTTPYLTVLSFKYDKETNIIDQSSVKIN
ncbi:putative phosphoglycerate mutase family protein [Tupanvirus deep ocean]|uniref:Phosphoglycerate mutase family protein n=2 Tax=Tupanvirus TaxID=2094720 RepID=A0AC62AA82_9VIRU|nr:putative phosphoglycerate mutase family protein [Tupanvirus deep ocean]QKU34558.1 putative phosphoglycerate mutase family protein [Tupanvirus deep ocean]